MNRNFSPDILERSYLLPNDAHMNDSVIRGVSLRQACERIEKIDEILRGKQTFEGNILCRLCISDLKRKTNTLYTEQLRESDVYKASIQSYSALNNKASEHALNSLLKEQSSLERILSSSKIDETKSFVAIQQAQDSLLLTSEEHKSMLRSVCDLDFQISSIDSKIHSVLERLDAASREVNFLQQTSDRTNNDDTNETLTSIKNVIAPLFDTILIDETSKVATINNCRLAYSVNSRLNLNHSEINLAFVHLCGLTQALRNLYGIPSSSSTSISATSSSGGESSNNSSHPIGSGLETIDCGIYSNKANVAYFLKEYKEGVFTTLSDTDRQPIRHLMRIIESRQQHTADGPVICNSLLKCRSLKERVMIQLITTTTLHSALPQTVPVVNTATASPASTATTKKKIKEWLYVESGIQRNTRANGARRQHKLRKARGSSGVDATTEKVWRSTSVDKKPSVSVSNDNTNLSANTASLANSLSNMFTSNVLPILVSSTTNISNAFRGGSGDISSDKSNNNQCVSVNNSLTSPRKIDEPVDDLEYRRAVLAVVAYVSLTCMQVLLCKHNLLKTVSISANSTLYNFTILSSLITTHGVGSCRGIMYAMLLGIPIGYEIHMVRDVIGVEGDSSGSSEGEGENDVEDHEDGVFILSKQNTSQNREKYYQQKEIMRKSNSATALSGYAPLFDAYSLTSEVQQVLFDTLYTLRNVCSL